MNLLRRPLIIPLIGLIAGIVTGNYFDLSVRFLLICLIFILMALLVALRKEWRIAALMLIIVFAFNIGIFLIQQKQYLLDKNNSISQYTDAGKMTLEGIIIESPAVYPEKNILIVSCVRMIKKGTYIPVSGNIRLAVPADFNFSYGDFIRFHSVLKKIRTFQNPGGFDYELYLKRQGIYATGYIADSSGIILLRENSASSIKFWIESFRIYLKQIIYSNAPSPQREIIEAMIIGNQNSIPADIRDNFNKTGTSHILSISGLHIGMVAVTAFFLISLILKSSEYLLLRLNIIKVSATASFVLVIIYALIAGMGVTVVRSTLMALVFLIALIFGKQKDLYNTLALAGLVILIILPESLFDISFQLSFMSVLSIIYIVPRFSNLSFAQFTMLPIMMQIGFRYLYMLLIVSLAATIGTLPLIVYYFNRISAITILANMVAVPLLGTLALGIAMVFLLSAFFSPVVAGFMIKIASFFVGMSVAIINKMASFAWSTIIITKPTLPEIVAFYVFLIILIQFIDLQKFGKEKKGFFLRHSAILKYTLVIMVIVFIGDAVYLSQKDKYARDLKITAIDVGQGMSVLVRFPGGGNMLIDGGGFADSSFDVGKMVIAPYLYQERISKIDTVVLTHPHPDHMLGLLHILENFNVGEVWSTGVTGDYDNYQKWRKIIINRKIKTVVPVGEMTLDKDNKVAFNILWPSLPDGNAQRVMPGDDVNDTSMVFQIKYGQIAFLITGDISANIENILVRSGKKLQSDVLFVPHHGSSRSSSSAFIKKVACRYALISAGKDNPFHHPALQTLDRYKAENIQILRTDQEGAVTLKTDGNILSVDPYVKHR